MRRRLTDLKNIGQKIAGRLNEAGIFTEDDLRTAGAVVAYQKIRRRYPHETLPVCYYLYSLEGALRDKHWDDLPQTLKDRLLAEVRSRQLGGV